MEQDQQVHEYQAPGTKQSKMYLFTIRKKGYVLCLPSSNASQLIGSTEI